MIRRIGQRLVYWLARVAIGIAAIVPEWLGYGAAALLGRTFYWCDARRRRYALHYLKNAFPERSERELRRLGARATGAIFKVPLDMAKLTRLLARGGSLDRVVEFPDVERWTATPRPFLALTAHIGSWEVAGAALASRVGEAHGIARVFKNPFLQRWLLLNRTRAGLHIQPRRGGFRDLARAVAGGAVGLQVVDQNQRLRGVFAPFFGEIASCERAAVSLALRHGYPLLVGAGLRIGRGFRFRLQMGEAFVLSATGDKAKDLLRGVGEVNRRLEDLIRSAPEQYLWIHDRYRRKPPPGWVPGGDADDGDEGGDE